MVKAKQSCDHTINQQKYKTNPYKIADTVLQCNSFEDAWNSEKTVKDENAPTTLKGCAEATAHQC